MNIGDFALFSCIVRFLEGVVNGLLDQTQDVLDDGAALAYRCLR